MYLVAQVTQDAWRLISLQTYNHLLNLDISFHLSGTKQSLFSIHKAKKGIETNLKFTCNMIIPSAIEALVGSALLLYYTSPYFTLIFLSSVIAFISFTRVAGRVINLKEKNFFLEDIPRATFLFCSKILNEI